jgi:ATP-binding cassette subfamily B protein
MNKRAASRAGTVIPSLVFAVRQAWQADRLRVVQVVLIQCALAGGLAGLLLLVRGVLGDVFELTQGNGTTPPGRFVLVIAVTVAFGTAGSILQVLSTAGQRLLATKVDRHLIAQVLRTAGAARLAEFENPAFHDRLQRAVSASRHEPAMVVVMLAAMFEAVLTALAVSGAFIVMAWWLLPLTLLAALPVVKAARDERIARYGLHVALGENRRLREYYERLLSSRDDAKEVRALELGETLRTRWDDQYERELAETIAVTRTHMWLKIKARLTGDLVVALVIVGVWWLVAAGVVHLTAAVAGLAGLWLLSSRIQLAVGMFNNLGESILYLQDLRIFTAAATSTGTAGTGQLPSQSTSESLSSFPGLQADRLTFAYPGSAEPVLREVSMTLGPGEIVALVGPNGSGKTTLAKLFAGLYPPESGRLLLGADPVERHDALRRQTTVVFQDFSRYKLSALDNVAFGRPDRPVAIDRVMRAARQAGAHEFVEALPNGYDTVLGKEFSGGVDLSGGQWQRLALARAFYRDSTLVILDEPTAALDPQAEADLFARIRELFRGRTVLLISHRFSSVRGADRIYVLDRGRIIEQGTHDLLMREDGTYARLFRLQALPYQAGGEDVAVPHLDVAADGGIPPTLSTTLGAGGA